MDIATLTVVKVTKVNVIKYANSEQFFETSSALATKIILENSLFFADRRYSYLFLTSTLTPTFILCLT